MTTPILITALISFFIFGMLVVGVYRRSRLERYQSRTEENLNNLWKAIGQNTEEERQEREDLKDRMSEVETAMGMYTPDELAQLGHHNGSQNNVDQYYEDERYDQPTSHQAANLRD